MDVPPPYSHAEFGTKLGHLQPGGGQSRFRHPHVWQREPAGNQERIVAGPDSGFVDLVLRLVECLKPPYAVMYVLSVARKCEPGRYQLEQPVTLSEIKQMIEPFRAFLEGDARHHLWIYSAESAATVVYDLHDLIYAYGPLDCYIQVLTEAGLKEGKVELPYPHMHNYFDEFDADEERLISSFAWKRTGLLPGVDD